MLHRLRHAMEQGSFEKLSGEVEADESYIGGRGFNMHKSRKAKYNGKRGIAMNKTPVMGIKQRDGDVIAKVIPNTKRPTIQAEVRRHVERGATLYSDKLLSYTGLEGEYDHQVIDHAVAYVEGKISTNQLENFWALLKRSLHGTYVSVDPAHLGRYVAEQVCRFNARYSDDAGRFMMVLGQTAGKRLTYDDLKKSA